MSRRQQLTSSSQAPDPFDGLATLLKGELSATFSRPSAHCTGIRIHFEKQIIEKNLREGERHEASVLNTRCDDQCYQMCPHLMARGSLLHLFRAECTNCAISEDVSSAH